jgi:RNA polymerase sigma-70 factor (ECF subfamily)
MRRIQDSSNEEDGVSSNNAEGDASKRMTLGPARDPVERLEELFDSSYDHIVRFCAIRVGNKEIAEDIAAVVFVDAARIFATQGGFDIDVSWLYMVARRRLIDHWRSAERYRKRLRRVVQWRAAVGQADGDIEGDQTAAHVQNALASLPERQRALLTLRYLDGYSVSEIAGKLAITYRAAESALARARRSFAVAWTEIQ